MAFPVPAAIETEVVEYCPACGSHGTIAFTGCADYVCGLPGNWNFCACSQCRSLWMNPRPIDKAVPNLYPNNYELTRSTEVFSEQLPSGFRGSLKVAILKRAYGYGHLPATSNSWPGRWLAESTGRLAGLTQLAGYSVRYLRCREKGKLLDVGCGNGAFMHWMDRLGWETHGIEPDPVAANIGIARGLNVQITDVQNATLPALHFDAVTLTHVIEHVPLPADVFEILGRCLKPGGILVSISPNPAGILRRIFGNKWYELDSPRHFVLPTERAYRQMLEPLDFEVKTWTMNRLFYWAAKESLSIRKFGAVDRIRDSAALKLAATVVSLLLSIFPRLGEEVVCYARKR